MNSITLADALNQMDNRQPFEIKYVAFNKNKNTGGEVKQITNAIKVSAKYQLKTNDMICVKTSIHSDHPMPIHIYLLLEFNKQRILI